ncbi:DUF6428 family protein [Ichthyenterobacterium magnum]|uniref:Uncharacterized protein n=1 Tax=Ichthyenterobacterium magnum TaxID=1230530 RepID=A0A420DWL7_9FLAO|nr:DUF6428 family protein [Ichthyenterobacterium magnum]RKE98632.1 hypothetical protein BXY80_0724 [Ichthyenterobacterium magnum]
MNTQELFNVLEQNQDKSLLFEYAPNLLVGANYHITEVKHISIDSVDCGSQTDAWKETIIQLWESPSELGKTEFMSVYKALAILKKVGTIKPYTLDSEVKFEYSNATFHTAQQFVNDYEIKGNNLIIKLAIEKTACKAKETCGVSEELETVSSSEEPCCSPNGNCC